MADSMHNQLGTGYSEAPVMTFNHGVDMNQPLKAPLPLLILDMIGSLLMLWGIVEHFGWLHLMPAAWQFPYYTPVLLVSGLLLIMPYQFKIVLEALRRRGSGQAKP